MRAGLAASGPVQLWLVLRLCSASKGYGFVLQPTGAARAVTKHRTRINSRAGGLLLGSALSLQLAA